MYRIISEGVSTFSGDAILNLFEFIDSIANVPGKSLYRLSVLAGDGFFEEISEKAEKNKNEGVFISSSYGLPCAKVLNVITPNRSLDPSLTQLKRMLENALQKAYKAGIRSLCVPIIGETVKQVRGYKRYTAEEIFDVTTLLVFEFCDKHKDFEGLIDIFEAPRSERHMKAGICRDGSSKKGKRFDDYDMEPTGADGVTEKLQKPIRLKKEPRLPQIGTKIPAAEIQMDCIGIKTNDSLGRVIDLFIAARDGLDPSPSKWRDLVTPWNIIKSRMIGVTSAETGMDEEDICDNPKARWHKHAQTKKGHKKNPDIPYGVEDPNGKWNCPDQLDLVLAACALGMTKKQCEFLMHFCGYHLSEYSSDDMAVEACFECLATKTKPAEILDVYPTYEDAAGYSPLKRKLRKQKTA